MTCPLLSTTPLPGPTPPDLMASLNSNIQVQNRENLSDLLSSPHAQLDTRSPFCLPQSLPHPVPHCGSFQFPSSDYKNLPLLFSISTGLPLQALLTWHPTTLPWMVVHTTLCSKYMHLSKAVWEPHNLASLFLSNHRSSNSQQALWSHDCPVLPDGALHV